MPISASACSSRKGATNTTLQKLQSELMIHWDAVQDMAKEDARKRSIPDVVKSFAGNDDRRALVIWTKVKLRTEFPQNFDEAVNFPSINPAAPSGYLYQASNIVIPVKSSYKQGILNYVAMNNIIPAQNLSVDQAHRESAALLYMSLTQSRRGMQAFNPDEHLGPHAISTTNLYGVDFKVFVDTWGQPIPFIRWGTGTNAARDINQPPYATPVNIGGAAVPSRTRRIRKTRCTSTRPIGRIKTATRSARLFNR